MCSASVVDHVGQIYVGGSERVHSNRVWRLLHAHARTTPVTGTYYITRYFYFPADLTHAPPRILHRPTI
jgi:hypothetical protein